MFRRLPAAAHALLQGMYGIVIEIVALVVLFAVGAVIAVVLSQMV